MSLVDSLAQLDPTNDEHWTTNGDPLLNVVKDIHGSAVTRAQINEAVPGFSRSNFDLVAKGEADETEAQETADAQVKSAEGTVEEDAGVDNVENEQKGTDEAKNTEAEEGEVDELKVLEEEAKALRALISKSKNDLNKVVAEMDVIIRSREETVNGATQSELIKRFQAQQAKQREAAFKG